MGVFTVFLYYFSNFMFYFLFYFFIEWTSLLASGLDCPIQLHLSKRTGSRHREFPFDKEEDWSTKWMKIIIYLFRTRIFKRIFLWLKWDIGFPQLKFLHFQVLTLTVKQIFCLIKSGIYMHEIFYNYVFSDDVKMPCSSTFTLF